MLTDLGVQFIQEGGRVHVVPRGRHALCGKRLSQLQQVDVPRLSRLCRGCQRMQRGARVITHGHVVGRWMTGTLLDRTTRTGLALVAWDEPTELALTRVPIDWLVRIG